MTFLRIIARTALGFLILAVLLAAGLLAWLEYHPVPSPDGEARIVAEDYRSLAIVEPDQTDGQAEPEGPWKQHPRKQQTTPACKGPSKHKRGDLR